MGSINSTVRTPFQTETALFWAGDSPVAMWDRVADDLAVANHLTLTENALLLARMNVAMADAMIAIVNAKNTFNRWRPITAIQQAGHRRQPRHRARPRLDAADRHALLPGVPIGPLRCQ